MRRFIATVLLPCYLAACLTWQPQEVSPEQALGDGQPDKVRLTLIDGNRIVMEEPRILGDSLTGVYSGRQVTIPLSAVTEVELRGNISGEEAIAAVFVTAAFLGLVAVVVIPQWVKGMGPGAP